MVTATDALLALFGCDLSDESYQGALLLADYILRTGVQRDKAEAKAAERMKAKR